MAPAAPLTRARARELERCVAAGGVALFPADTVYGLCCDPEDARAAARLYELKGRPPERPAAVMFFTLERSLEALPELAAPERAALAALLPGPVTLLLGNPRRRFGPACGPEPETLGLRVPALAGPLDALREVGVPVMQSSANLSGGPDARRLQDVPESVREGAALALDAGELPGVASTVIDLRGYASSGAWEVLRAGPLAPAEIARALGPAQS